MKNKYNWEQVADVYNKELGINYTHMEEYLRGIYSEGISNYTLEEHEQNIKELLNKSNNNKSEYFPDFYL